MIFIYVSYLSGALTIKYPRSMKNLKYLIISLLALTSVEMNAAGVTTSAIEEDFSFTCADATELYCGSPYWQNAKFDNHFTSSDYGLSGCYTGYLTSTYTYEGKDYLYWIDIGAAPKDVTISLTGLATNFDLFVFKNCQGSYGSTRLGDCQGGSTNVGIGSESVYMAGASGIYYIVVDGPHAYNNSNFEILVSCANNSNPPYGGPHYFDNCSSGYALDCGDVLYVESGGNNSFEKANYDLSACTHASYGYEGYDQIFHVDLGHTPRNVTFKLGRLYNDLDMFIFQTCSDYAGATRFSNCVGYSDNSSHADEVINLYGAHGKYIVVVDGFASGVTSSFELSMDCNVQAATSCYDAEPLLCGESKWMDASHNNYYEYADYDLSSCLGTGYGYTGNDHLFRIDAGGAYGSNKKLIINMTGLRADLDLLLFQSCSSDYGSSQLNQCIDYSRKTGISDETITINNAYGTYYLAVDSADPWYSSSFEISLDCQEAAPDICYYASPLYCGDSKWVASPTRNNLDDRHYNYSSCTGFKYGFTGSDHLYKIDAGYGSQNITIELSNLSADLDMMLFQSCDTYNSAYGLSQCVATSLNQGRTKESITIWDASGTYYLAVDAVDPWDKSGYEISVSCHDRPASYTCDDAKWIACNEERWSEAPTKNNISTSGYNMSACGNWSNDYLGYDHLYEFTTGYGDNRVSISLSGLTADMDLLVFSACGSNYATARLAGCVGYSTNTGSDSEHVVLEHASGTYYIAVDGRTIWDRSQYKLKVDCHAYDTSDGDHVDDSTTDDAASDDSDGDGAEDESDDNADGSTEDPTTALTCGDSYSGTTIGRSSDFNNEDIVACFQTDLVYTGGDILIPFEKSSDEPIELTLAHGDANLSLFVLDEDLNFVDGNCRGFNYSSSGLVENRDVVGEIYTDSGLAQGKYYALVEGYNRSIETDFTLSMSCSANCVPTQSLACESALTDLTTVDQANGRSSYISPDGDTQVGYTGGEWAATLTIDSTAEVTIDLFDISEGENLDLFILASCDDNSFIASSTNDDDSSEQITLSLEPGNYVILVDGSNGSAGSFSLEVTGCGDVTQALREDVSVARSATKLLSASTGLEVSSSPNPFASSTILRINSMDKEPSQLQIYTVDGRVIYNQSVNLQKGDNQITLDSDELGQESGVLLYRVVTTDRIAQGTILRVK